MKYFMNKTLLASCSIAAAVFFACGDDTSSNFNDEGSTVLPDTLESFVDLQAYNCGASLKCQGVYVRDMGYGVCDGKGGWRIRLSRLSICRPIPAGRPTSARACS